MGAAGGAAAAAAIANAIKASGIFVKVSQQDFQSIVNRNEKPLVIAATGGIFTTNYQYLTSYKGFSFYTKTSAPLMFSPKAEIVNAKKIWIPS